LTKKEDHHDGLQKIHKKYSAFDLPQTRQFWRKHPRMYWQLGSHIDYNGQTAVISRFQSRTDTAYLDIICAQDTLKVLDILGKS
jgi:hypothetical protein